MKAKDKTSDEVSILEINQTQMTFRLVGKSPLVPHAVSFKAASQLLYPSGRKNEAEKATSMKHEPFEEFRDAAYKFDKDNQPTRLYMPAAAFHGAMANAAIDMVGAKKSQIGRLTSVIGDKVCIWGIPQIWSTIVRSSDLARTPDVRTLPIIPQWAAEITVEFISSLIKPASVGNLLGAAGTIIGIGDGRPQKGKLAFGKFRVCSENDQEFAQIVKFGGRKVQDGALADPKFYDLETERLLHWFAEERDRRVAMPTATPRRSKRNGGDVSEVTA